VCWYSGWIMAGKQKMVRHLPERVLRQYDYVQTVPRPPTMILPLAPADVAAAFLEIALHVVSQQERGEPVPDDEPWKHLDGYMRWFYRVSILLSSALLPFLSTWFPDLSTRRFLLSRSGSDILPIHCRSSAT